MRVNFTVLANQITTRLKYKDKIKTKQIKCNYRKQECISVGRVPPTSMVIVNLCCCDMGQNDTIGKIELFPSIVLSSEKTNCKNDIQLFSQLFDELRVNGDYH